MTYLEIKVNPGYPEHFPLYDIISTSGNSLLKEWITCTTGQAVIIGLRLRNSWHTVPVVRLLTRPRCANRRARVTLNTTLGIKGVAVTTRHLGWVVSAWV